MGSPSSLANRADYNTKCTPGFRVGCILLCPGCIFKGWGAFALGGVHLDKLEVILLTSPKSMLLKLCR